MVPSRLRGIQDWSSLSTSTGRKLSRLWMTQTLEGQWTITGNIVKYWNHVFSKAKSCLKQKSKLHWNPSIGDFFVKAKSSTNDGVSTSEGFLCSEKSFSLA